jgi:hypothetical protein
LSGRRSTSTVQERSNKCPARRHPEAGLRCRDFSQPPEWPRVDDNREAMKL